MRTFTSRDTSGSNFLLVPAMNDVKLGHPALEQLQAFAQGRLAEAELSAIHEHLADCALCRAQVEATGDDTLVGLLRRADTEPNTVKPPDLREAETLAAPQAAAADSGLPP